MKIEVGKVLSVNVGGVREFKYDGRGVADHARTKSSIKQITSSISSEAVPPPCVAASSVQC